MRVALTSLLVAAGIGVVGVVPALAADSAPAPKAFERAHQHGPYRWFHDRGDVRYVWFRVCDTTATGATTAPTTPAAGATDTVAPDALTAAVEGAAVETATVADTATTTDTLPATDTVPTTTTTTADEDAPDAKAYPTFIVVPLPKDEAKALRKLDERPCYDLTTGAPQVTATTTTTDAAATDLTPATETTPAVETTTPTPVDTATG